MFVPHMLFHLLPCLKIIFVATACHLFILSGVQMTLTKTGHLLYVFTTKTGQSGATRSPASVFLITSFSFSRSGKIAAIKDPDSCDRINEEPLRHTPDGNRLSHELTWFATIAYILTTSPFPELVSSMRDKVSGGMERLIKGEVVVASFIQLHESTQVL